jgi:crotonobetainyl-CoA:carnitine CoA-transferase CaiB-like acyl-CoA transferase
VTQGPLQHIRVVEIGGGVAGAYCGKLFADFGARVTKIEPPGGDPLRREPPLVDVGDGTRESAYFAWANTNKDSVTAVLDDAADASRILAELADADVLIDARPPQDRTSGSFSDDALRTWNPSLVIVAISWFGEDGPYRDFAATDTTCRALAGIFKLAGPIEGPPMLAHGHQGEIVAGISAFIAAAAGLYAEGRGRTFALSIQEANVVVAEYQVFQTLERPESGRRYGVNRFAPTYPLGIYRCREGWIGATVVNPVQWRSFCALMGMPDAAGDPRYATNFDRLMHADELEARYLPLFLERTAAEWFALGLQRRLPFVIVPDMEELLRQPVHRSRGAFQRVTLGAATFEGPALPQQLTTTPPLREGRAPRAGEHTSRPPASPREPQEVTGAPQSSLPLAGLRIVDFSMGWAGPVATRQIADLGAEVIKIEACQYPDWWRGVLTDNHAYERSRWFNGLNRNKLGITLDLTSPDGARLAKQLVARAHAVVENYSREVLPKLGLGYEALLKVRPNLVMVSMPAFGSDGPWADTRAYGSTLEHASGLPSVTGRPDDPPTINHIAYGDPVGGLNAAAALLVALLHQKRTGEGQRVDLSQVQCMFPLVAPWIVEQSATGRVAPRRGNRHPEHVPHGAFGAAGDDKWLAVAIADDDQWRALCRVIGRADLGADRDLATAEGRRRKEAVIEEAIEAWTRQRTADDAMAALQAAGVPAGVLRAPVELLSDANLMARGFWREIDRAFVGRNVQSSTPYREGKAPYPVRNAAPTLGEFNAAVLRDILGLDEAELDRLARQGIIGTEALPVAQRSAKASTG